MATKPTADPALGLAAISPTRDGGGATPRVAHVVAEELRRRIIVGEVQDGELLPKQDELLVEFGVSHPTMREALRVLEAEGLISVRRGRLGGAVVHRPQVDNAAYVIELVLQSRQVPVTDVGEALRQFEPVCASLCALREDRAETVLPRLRAIHAESKQCIDDFERFARVLRSFHEEIVAACGNQTVILVVGALEKIHTAHAEVWASERLDEDSYPDLAYRQRGVDDHELLLLLIERGDSEGAARIAREHLAWTPIYEVRSESEVVPLLLGRPSGPTDPRSTR